MRTHEPGQSTDSDAARLVLAVTARLWSSCSLPTARAPRRFSSAHLVFPPGAGAGSQTGCEQHAVRRGVQPGGRGPGYAGLLAVRVAAESGGDSDSCHRPGPDARPLPAVQTRNQ